MKLSIIIPCYNEEKTIKEVIRRVDSVDLGSIEKEIIVVDDGSLDNTGKILKEIKKDYKFFLFKHKRNIGKGAAIKTALKYASGDYVIIQDADLEYDPDDYNNLLRTALKKRADVVYGFRHFGKNRKYSYLSFYLGGLFLTWLVNFLYNIKISDEATGYKLFKKEIIDSIELEAKGFEFCPEITAKIAKKGIKIYEVPINYNPRTKDEGKKIKWKDGVKAVWTLIKYKLRK